MLCISFPVATSIFGVLVQSRSDLYNEQVNVVCTVYLFLRPTRGGGLESMWTDCILRVRYTCSLSFSRIYMYIHVPFYWIKQLQVCTWGFQFQAASSAIFA